jgi:hypothetical protein
MDSSTLSIESVIHLDGMGVCAREDLSLTHFFFLSIFKRRGENVSTTEVGEIIAAFEGVDEVTVYGVQVPGNDGR